MPTLKTLPYETQVKIVAEVFEAINENAKKGGTFRHLIYDIFGFDLDAYAPLYSAGVMNITNAMIIKK